MKISKGRGGACRAFPPAGVWAISIADIMASAAMVDIVTTGFIYRPLHTQLLPSLHCLGEMAVQLTPALRAVTIGDSNRGGHCRSCTCRAGCLGARRNRRRAEPRCARRARTSSRRSTTALVPFQGRSPREISTATAGLISRRPPARACPFCWERSRHVLSSEQLQRRLGSLRGGDRGSERRRECGCRRRQQRLS